MTPDEQLKQTSKDFDQWRLSQPHRSAEIPAALRQAALRLLNDFPIPRVAKCLGISSSTIYLWRKPAPQKKVKPASSAKPATFIPLPVEALPSDTACSLTLQVAQELQLTLRGELSAHYVAQLVQELRR